MSFLSSKPGSGGGGVESLNALTGALNLVEGAGIDINSSGSNITISTLGATVDNTTLEVKVATTAVLPGTPNYNNGTGGVGATLTRSSNGTTGTIDGITAANLMVGDRILVKNQASQLQNGIYVITQQGTASLPYILTRATDADTTAEMDDMVAVASAGTANKGIPFGQQTNNPTIGTNNIVFTSTGIYMKQQSSGTQAINQIPVYTGTALTQTKGTANFKYNPTNDLFTIRGIDYTFPANNGDASQVLTTDGSGTLSWTTPAGGSPAGSDTQIQYNNGGSFGADSGFTRDATTKNTNISATYGDDTFSEILNSAILTDTTGIAQTMSSVSGDTIFHGIYRNSDKGDLYSKNEIVLSDGSMVSEIIDMGTFANVIYAYNGSSFLSGTSVIASDSIQIYNDVGAGNELGFFVESGTLLLGNRNGGNGTKITIDDVNKTIALTADGNTAYSSDIPLSAKVTVSPADMLAVVTGPTPYQLIAAPGAGKFIDIISIACYVNFNTTAYDFNGALRIGTNTTGSTTIGTDGGQVTVSPYNMINATTSKLSVVGSQAGEKNINTALYLNAGATTTVTQGDSDVTFYIMYKVVTL